MLELSYSKIKNKNMKDSQVIVTLLHWKCAWRFFHLILKTSNSATLFFFYCAEWRRRSPMDLSTSRHAMSMSNITCTTQVLLGLSLEPLISKCRTRTPTIKLYSVWCNTITKLERFCQTYMLKQIWKISKSLSVISLKMCMTFFKQFCNTIFFFFFFF